ncbi:MAG: hypothetical protein JHC57_21035 [Sphingopyxis sp.]|uniref:hypothetical protein n=1 Tax=Sphingopyxis sp. TaxID=1908224 RepID=UPI001A30BDB1|nr:hypothetical protein [Sphingopyxis sp.]MBJ7502252.1 hypothetical protein [Sphingopyxis sp.]
MKGSAVRVIILATLLAGCAKSPENPPVDADTERLKSMLARVETECEIKHSVLKLGSDNQVTVLPSADEKYEAVDCLLRELKKPQFANHIKLGFVGNEMHPREEQK